MLLFRVETRYGVHDADSLREAKANSKPSDHIQTVAPDGLTILSRYWKKFEVYQCMDDEGNYSHVVLRLQYRHKDLCVY